jgi:hypothetical protein
MIEAHECLSCGLAVADAGGHEDAPPVPVQIARRKRPAVPAGEDERFGIERDHLAPPKLLDQGARLRRRTRAPGRQVFEDRVREEHAPIRGLHLGRSEPSAGERAPNERRPCQGVEIVLLERRHFTGPASAPRPQLELGARLRSTCSAARTIARSSAGVNGSAAAVSSARGNWFTSGTGFAAMSRSRTRAGGSYRARSGRSGGTGAWNGYLLTVTCPCGVTFERWVTPEEADADLLRLSRLN